MIPSILWHKNSGRADIKGDCDDGDDDDGGACSVAAIPPHPHLTATHWQIASQLYTHPLSADHVLVFTPRSPVGAVVLHQSIYQVLTRYHTPTPLPPDNDIGQTLAQVGLLRPIPALPTPYPLPPTTLTAWLHVTNACNLRCSYCYINHTSEAMSLETGQKAIEAIFRTALSKHFKAVRLKYAGGEATLNFGLIKELHHYATQLATQHQLTLHQVILSNGVALSQAMLDFISQHQIGLMISLDSLNASHDQQRPFRNGQGSLKQVKQGIERALAGGVSPYLSITVTTHNAADLAETVSYALAQGVKFGLNFYRQHTHEADLQAEDEQLINGVLAAFQVIEANLPPYSLMQSLDRANFRGAHTHTCGVGRNYVVIDHQGQVSPCHMELDHPITHINAPNLLIPLQTHSTGFQNLSVEEKTGCRDCDWRYFCSGGCPLLTYRVTGRSDVQSPYCHVYQALYPALLRLEGLRLLKWHAHNTL